jgi:hypothetical protein
VRRYRGPAGDWRVWLDHAEIEARIEDELHRAGLFPTAGNSVVDVERLVEIYLGVDLDQHALLELTVLGCTEFRRGEPPRIQINRDLTGSAMDADASPLGLQGRWRATVAHEAVHVVLHRDLIEPSADQPALFDENTAHEGGGRVVRCLKRDVRFDREPRDWREVQANYGMAALLMPRQVFMEVAREEAGGLRPEPLPFAAGADAAFALAGRVAWRFMVSRQAASIRLETLGLVRVAGSTALPL